MQFTPLNLKACFNNSVITTGFCAWVPLREKCPNTELFLVLIFLYSVRIQSEYRKIRTRNNSVFGHFSRSVPSCICHALYLIFTHDNVINLVIYATYFVGVWVDDWVWPCCYMAFFLLEGSVAQKFVVVFIPLNKFLSVIIPMTAGPFSYTGFKLICFSKMSIKVFWYWNHWCWQILEVIVNGCHVIVEIAEFHWVLSCSFCCWSIHIDYCDYVVYQIFVWWDLIFWFVGF